MVIVDAGDVTQLPAPLTLHAFTYVIKRRIKWIKATNLIS